MKERFDGTLDEVVLGVGDVAASDRGAIKKLIEDLQS